MVPGGEKQKPKPNFKFIESEIIGGWIKSSINNIDIIEKMSKSGMIKALTNDASCNFAFACTC